MMEWGNTHGAITKDADTTLYLNLNNKTSKDVAQPQKEMLKQILECPSADEHYLRCTSYGIKSSETIVLDDDSKTTATTSATCAGRWTTTTRGASPKRGTWGCA